MDIAEIEEKMNSLEEIEELTPIEAMSRANDIVKAINKVVEEQVEEEDYETLEKLYRKAADIYLLAAEKVPRESRDRVAFPANYWSMRATQVGLMLRKPSASRFKVAHISTPLEIVEIDTITPSLKSEIDNSKQIHEMELQYRKRRNRLKEVNKEELTLKSFNAELIAAIVAKTSLNADEIKNWDIEKIEKKLGIRAQAPKMYFAWEEGDKFMPKKIIEKRESQMDALLRNS